MKKKRLLILFLYIMLSLVGCTKLTNVEYKNVEVIIKNIDYVESTTDYYLIGTTIGTETIPEEYNVIVDYNNVEYCIDSKESFEKYKDKVGQTTIGTLEIRTYDDGTVRYDITELR